jgi:mRNA interferase YafQ
MRDFRFRSSCKKDFKRIVQRGYDVALLADVLDWLAAATFPAARRDHPLKGEWVDWRECHINPDWLLIYRATEDEVVLARTGTHADLFGS